MSSGFPSGPAPAYAVVIPTVGRPSLHALLDSLAAQQTDAEQPGPVDIIVVDDRRPTPGAHVPPLFPSPAADAAGVRAGATPGREASVSESRRAPRVIAAHGRGPAHARNRGWRATSAQWICFLDDDVVLPAGWIRALQQDLHTCTDDVGASQGRIRVPLTAGARPNDWQRNTAALETARWATADMAYRRTALAAVHGFDERFPRAFREDADLALRVRQAGWRLTRGTRHIVHPVRPADMWVSARVQAGNADDALMRRLHGRRWRVAAVAPGGGFGLHVATTAAAAGAVTSAMIGAGFALRPRLSRGAIVSRRLAGISSVVWAGLTLRFLLHRVAPGPRPGDPRFTRELATMAVTSVLIPPLAVFHRVTGAVRHRRATAWPPPVRAVLFDRDGTLIEDVPYNSDPEQVRPVPGAVAACRHVREAGLPVAVVSNQSAIGRRLATAAQVDRVDGRVRELLGPFDAWSRCPHAPEDGCSCRKPAPGMIVDVARRLRVRVGDCVMIGDIGADVEAADAAGARSILVPTPVTRREEVADAPCVADDLTAAVAHAIELARLNDQGMLDRPASPPRSRRRRGGLA